MQRESLKCKGVRDLVPHDMATFRLIEHIFIDSCTKWGYEEVRTPTIEYLHLFTSAGTLSTSLLNKVYSFLDWDGWSGERVSLRPDGTIPVARLYMENLAKQKIDKLFYVTNVFSFEETKNENRERWQCGVEYFGNSDPISDFELLLLASNILNKLQVKNIEIKLSHSKLLKLLFKEMNLDVDEEKKILSEVKEGKWKSLIELNNHNSHTNSVFSIMLNMQGCSTSFLENIKSLPNISTELAIAIDTFASVTTLLDKFDVKYSIDITSTNTFEYYTGICYKFMHKAQTVAAGGRYDDLIPLLGGDRIPACGFALYVDPIMQFAQQSLNIKNKNIVSLKILQNNSKSLKSYFSLMEKLVENKFTVELYRAVNKNHYLWNISLGKKPNIFIVQNNTSHQTSELNSVNDVVNLISKNK